MQVVGCLIYLCCVVNFYNIEHTFYETDQKSVHNDPIYYAAVSISSLSSGVGHLGGSLDGQRYG